MILSALVECAGNLSLSGSRRYIEFVKSELISVSEPKAECVAACVYCLLRCGLVHGLHLHGENISSANLSAINGYKIAITHDAAASSEFYSVDDAAKMVTLYAKEFLIAVRACVADCFTSGTSLYGNVQNSLTCSSVSIIAEIK